MRGEGKGICQLVALTHWLSVPMRSEAGTQEAKAIEGGGGKKKGRCSPPASFSLSSLPFPSAWEKGEGKKKRKETTTLSMRK